jgi:phosphohistidine swiveling domain-containing protein
MAAYILPLSDPVATLENVGGKGMSLARLIQAGFPVPGGFHVTTQAYQYFVTANSLQTRIQEALQGVDPTDLMALEACSAQINAVFAEGKMPEEISAEIAGAYRAMQDPAVAVRSSATAEDLPEASFAGQQESYLNLHGIAAVLEGVQKCWASLWTGRAIAYRIKNRIDHEQVALAVVVQELVMAEASGILFTANPVTGKRSEIIITAAWGLGEAIVSGEVTPDSLTVDKHTLRLVKRETAEKQVMTIRTASGTTQQPVPPKLVKKAVLSNGQTVKLARLGSDIEKDYGIPMDIEWALASGKIAILQARPITALPEAPIEWKAPYPKAMYMRASLVDLMPNPLSPLFITLGIPTMVKQMVPMGIRLMGAKPLLPADYFTSVNSYAYLNYNYPAKTWWWVLTGMLPASLRMLRHLAQIWRDELHPAYQATVESFQGALPAQMSERAQWQSIQELLDAVMFYVCGLMFVTMGASSGSELLLTKLYDKLVKREGDLPAVTFLMGWDNIPIRAEKSLYDLAMWVQERDTLRSYLLETPSRQLTEQMTRHQNPEGVRPNEWKEFNSRFEQHLKQFGYIIFQLDFAEPLPRDHPEPMLENIKMYLRGAGVNPHARQKASEEKRIQTAETMLKRLKGFKRWTFRKALNWAQSLSEIREDALAEIGLGYPMLRSLLFNLGQRFVEKGMIKQAEDILWLEKLEINALINGEELNLVEGVETLKAESPPPMIPMKERVMGIKTESFVPQAADAHPGKLLKGVPASAGKVTAPARVLHGPQDFEQMQPGEVLVTGTTTPAWTPLFAMASAVVTDIGGPLSHGSIVAREYGIPAVMGTGGATKRIKNGQMITVDGSAGTVLLH